MKPVIMVRLHHYAYGPCAYCRWNAIIRCSVVAHKWICLECLNQQLYFKHLSREAKLAIGEEYMEATIQLGKRGLLPLPSGEDIPLERMIAPGDMAWWKELA